jgi:hypothetical protein
MSLYQKILNLRGFFRYNNTAEKSGKDYYLKIGTARDLKDRGERFIYRCFEILPGALAWSTLFIIVLFSWKKPAWVAFFIILFDLYWLFRTIYFSFHLHAGYKRMKEQERINWLDRLKGLDLSATSLDVKNWKDIFHLVILPVFREPAEIVWETMRCLEKTDWPKEKMIVVLACEQRARKETEVMASQMEKEFKNKFFKFLVTWHPANLPGEVAGHGSNDAWASRQVKRLVIDALGIPYQNVIVSFFDCDTCVLPGYFSCLAWHYLTCPNPTRTSFQPIPLYLNNIWQVPVFSRVFAFSSSFWHTMNQERPEKLITFSSHSMSFLALVDAGFKQRNVVSDDSRIFWQCFLKYDGDYEVRPLYYSVSMDANVSENIFKTAANIYKQQRRWAYGAGEIPYFLFGFLKNKKIPFGKKFSLSRELIEGHLSWAVASVLIFCLGWLPLIFGGPEFSRTLISYNLPKITSWILTLSMAGLVVSAYLSLVLLPPLPPGDKKFRQVMFAFSWILVPIISLFFTAFPALDAQTRWMLGKYMGFWSTEKVRK